MLPTAARLRQHEDFHRTLRAGDRGSQGLLTVHVVRGDDERAPLRVGFVVSRRVGSAVRRNRLRRQLRHITSERLARLSRAAPGASVVVRLAPRAAVANGRELAADFDRAWLAALSGWQR